MNVGLGSRDILLFTELSEGKREEYKKQAKGTGSYAASYVFISAEIKILALLVTKRAA